MFEDQHDKGRQDGQFQVSRLTELEKELPFYLVGAGCDFYQYPVNRPFGYPDYQWIQTLSGTGKLLTNNKEIAVPKGFGIFISPGIPHRYQAAEDPWHVTWMTFNGYHIESMLKYIGMGESGVFTVSEPVIIETHIRKVLQLLKSNSELARLDGSVLAYQFLIYLYKYVVFDEKRESDYTQRRLLKIFTLIEEEMGKPLSTEYLAETAGITPQYFCEIFKNATNQRPTEYINYRRLEKAKDLMLADPFRKISDIAKEVGFESGSYFATVFKKKEGLSPNEYRKLYT